MQIRIGLVYTLILQSLLQVEPKEVMPNMEQLNMRRPIRRVDISINMEATGANIKRLIKASGYSVKDIMEITGISTEQAVYKWCRGESIPAIETMLILSNALGIQINELLVIDGDFHFFEDICINTAV